MSFNIRPWLYRFLSLAWKFLFFNIAGGSPTGGTLNGGILFVNGLSGKSWADSSLAYIPDTWVNVSPFGGVLTAFTINVWVNIASAGNTNINLVSQTYSDAGYIIKSDCNFLLKVMALVMDSMVG
mgnify:CR=1 FL=1